MTMSMWSELIFYSVRVPTREDIANLCAFLGVTRIPYVEMSKREPDDDMEFESAIENSSIQDSLDIACELARVHHIAMPIECRDYLQRISRDLHKKGGSASFSFLAASIELGNHELYGFSSGCKPGENEVGRSAGFSLSLGGDDPGAEFRTVWTKIQELNWFHELETFLNSRVEGMESDFILSA